MLLQSGIVPGAVTAVLLNLFLNYFGQASEVNQTDKASMEVGGEAVS
jgi:xanthine/uracil permease